MNLISWLPGIVRFGISLPFDQILEHSAFTMISVLAAPGAGAKPEPSHVS